MKTEMVLPVCHGKAPAVSPHYHVIGALSAQVIFRICVYMWVSTIIVCYIIAVSLGHVPAFLPMISDCAVAAPERYIFRLGFISGANWLFASSLLYYLYFRAHSSNSSNDNGCGGDDDDEKNNSVDDSATDQPRGPGAARHGLHWRVHFRIPPIASLVLAFLATISVAIVGAVNEMENRALHSFAAMSFFTLLQLYVGPSPPPLRIYQPIDMTDTVLVGVSAGVERQETRCFLNRRCPSYFETYTLRSIIAHEQHAQTLTNDALFRMHHCALHATFTLSLVALHHLHYRNHRRVIACVNHAGGQRYFERTNHAAT